MECIADTMNLTNTKAGPQEGEEVAIKNVCVQIIKNLYAVDYKLLDASVGKLDDLSRKTPLRKAIIEHESQQKQGRGLIDVSRQDSGLVVSGQSIEASGDRMRDT